MAEIRQHPREPIRLPVAFTLPSGERVEAVCENLSMGGMFVATERAAAFGASVQMTVRLGGAEFVLPSTVRWTNATGMGVQFGLLGARETHALARQLAAKSPVA